MGKNRRSYSREFKIEAVALVTEDGLSIGRTVPQGGHPGPGSAEYVYAFGFGLVNCTRSPWSNTGWGPPRSRVILWANRLWLTVMVSRLGCGLSLPITAARGCAGPAITQGSSLRQGRLSA
jgi:hypothetical protein